MKKHKYKITFCTTCMNRLHHYEKTAIQNIEAAAKFDCNIVLLDYGSTDGLRNWVAENLYQYLESGRISYFYVKSKFFHMAHAKNVSHRLATKQIVCNLDADNIIDIDSINAIMDVFDSCKKHVLIGPRSANGRVVILKRYFEELGGYDENLIGGSWLCRDLIKRACRNGTIKLKKMMEFDKFIQHDDEDRIKNLDPDIMENALSFDYGEFKFRDEAAWKCRHPYVYASVKYNNYITKLNLENNCVVANQDKSWGAAEVFDFHGKKIYTGNMK